MNDLLKNKLEILNQDEHLMEAIRMVFEERIEKERPPVNETSTNELIGERYRAYETARTFIDQAFVDLKTYQHNKETNKPFNKAR